MMTLRQTGPYALDDLPTPALRLTSSDADGHRIQARNTLVEAWCGSPVPVGAPLEALFGPSADDVAALVERSRGLGVPLSCQVAVATSMGDRTTQVLVAWRTSAQGGPEALLLLVDVTDLAVEAAQAQAAWARQKRRSETDTLTGALSRRAWHERVARHLDASQLAAGQGALLVFDLDHFKRVNDTHGHAAGDRVLAEVVAVVRNACRPTDAIGRLGGEEFGLLLPDASRSEARIVGERIIHACRGHEVALGTTSVRVTISAGLTAIVAADREVGAVLARADRALYEAKRRRRDVLAVYEEMPITLDDAEEEPVDPTNRPIDG